MSVKTRPSGALGASIMLVVCLLGLALFAAPSRASSVWWGLSSQARPTNLAPGSQGVVVAAASNIGDAVATGPVTITDRLPAGLTLAGSKSVAFRVRSFSLAGQEDLGPKGAFSSLHLCAVAAQTVSCTYPDREELEALGVSNPENTGFEPLRPYFGRLEMRITVNVSPKAPLGRVQNEIAVSGGTGGTASARRPLEVSEEEAPFGVEDYEVRLEEEGGAPDTQAGSHPFQLTNVTNFNQGPEAKAEEVEPVAQPRDLSYKLPPGMLGNATALPRCTAAQFAKQDTRCGWIRKRRHRDLLPVRHPDRRRYEHLFHNGRHRTASSPKSCRSSTSSPKPANRLVSASWPAWCRSPWRRPCAAATAKTTA